MMPRLTPNPPRRPAGFTLIEMLVTISIIVVLAGITFPVVSELQGGSRLSSAINTITIGLDTARNFADREGVAGFIGLEDNQSPTAVTGNGEYSGAALLFTPGGDLRVVVNDPRAAYASGNRLLEFYDSGAAGYPALPSPETNGYRDAPGRDYIQIPDRVGVVGLFRNPGGLEYLAPPFAIRFDNDGRLIARSDSSSGIDGHVYYDADGDGNIVLGDDRGTYGTSDDVTSDDSPLRWDWRSNPAGVPMIGTQSKRVLPFEKIETVIAVFVFDAQQFQAELGWAGADAEAGTDDNGIDDGDGIDDLTEWMDANATPLFVSRYTGTVLRD